MPQNPGPSAWSRQAGRLAGTRQSTSNTDHGDVSQDKTHFARLLVWGLVWAAQAEFPLGSGKGVRGSLITRRRGLGPSAPAHGCLSHPLARSLTH